MKKLFFSVLFLSFNLNAFEFKRLENNSWDQINKMTHIFVEWPKVNVAGVHVAVNNICTTGVELKTIKAVSVCTKTKVTHRQACILSETEICRDLNTSEQPNFQEQLREETACNKTEQQDLMTLRAYTTQECENLVYPHTEAGGAPYCDGKYVSVNKELPEVYDVPLIDNTSGPIRFARYVLGYKKYYLPKCGAF